VDNGPDALEMALRLTIESWTSVRAGATFHAKLQGRSDIGQIVVSSENRLLL
jgi:hypothetical protein